MIKPLFKNLILKFFFILFVFNCYNVYSQQALQELTTSSRRAREAFENAINHYNSWETGKAEEEFLRAIEIDPDFIEPYVILGEMYHDAQRYEDCIEIYKSAIEIDTDFFPNNHFYLANSKLKLGKYEKAKSRIKVFIKYDEISSEMRDKADRILEVCNFAIEAIESPVPFEPVNIGAAINTEFAEYSPSLTADETTIYFTRKQQGEHGSEYGPGEYEDIYYSHKDDGEWQPARNLGEPVNSPRNEGFLSVSADGQHLFFTACNRPSGVGSCDIYYSRRKGDSWEEPQNMRTPVNSRDWDSQPSTTADGKTLYFTSARRGNIGTTDIWMTEFQSDSTWKTPENLGSVINTSGREISPFIHPDNRTLFFASDGHIGMGGYDLFYSRRDEDGNWSEPVNLGYPINTHEDQFSLFIGASGREAYFASEADTEEDETDIYYFELYEEARPEPLTYMKGEVFDKYTKQPLHASFELIDLETDEVLINSESDAYDGSFLVAIPLDMNIGLNVSASEYMFFSKNFSLERAYTGIEPYHMDIPMRPIEAGETTVLRNIFFEYDEYELKPESKSELDRLVKLLENNPDIRIEIGGHTDNIGSYEYNKELSLNRAKSVYQYLAENGIDPERLEYEGYADTKPIDTNETEEGRANNRRTEFKILE